VQAGLARFKKVPPLACEKNAWGAVYEVLASVMKEGAAEVEKAA